MSTIAKLAAVNRQSRRSKVLASKPRSGRAVRKPRSSTILVVDDDPSLLRSLDMLLSASGFQVKTFAKPSELLASEVPRSDACMIVDINLPEVSGFRLSEILKASGIRLPIILITGRIDPAVHRLSEKAGAVALLFKPFEEQDLLDAIGSALSSFHSRTI
jgi:FixJ family two-component response regulator